MSTGRTVPFFNYPALFRAKKEETMKVIEDVLERGAYIQQIDLKRFETNLAKFLSCRHVIGVADCTEALTLSMLAIGIKPGDEVIVPSHTMVATAAASRLLGATIVLVDCGDDHLIDPKSTARAITSKTKAIVPVSLNGRTVKMDPILALAQEHGLHVIEDSAQALGSTYKGKKAGTFGLTGNFSFYPAKLLGCFGDGGAVSTNDDNIAEIIHELRDHGRNPRDGEVKRWGLNSRLDNLQAAILDLRLNTFEDDIQRRRDIARLYTERLTGLQELYLPPAPDTDPDHFDVYQNYEIEAEQRDALRTYLDGAGIKTIIQWGGKAIHQFENLGFSGLSLPRTELLFQRSLMLPMNTTLTDEDVDYVCDHIVKFYRRH